MLLELVESEPGFEEWVDLLSRTVAKLARCASSSLSACLDPLRYDGMKNDDLDPFDLIVSKLAAPNTPALPNGPEYDVPSLPLELDRPG